MCKKEFLAWILVVTVFTALIGVGIVFTLMPASVKEDPIVIHCKVHAMGKVYENLELIEFYDGIAEVKTKDGKFMYFKNFDLIEQD